MRIRTLALVAVALVAVVPSAFARQTLENPAIQEVSQAADVALWCGSAYVVASQMGGLNEQDSAKANNYAEVAFDKATQVLMSNGVASDDQDRIVSLYLEEAIRGLSGTENDLRYNDQVCNKLLGS